MPATFRGRPDATGNFVVPQRWLSQEIDQGTWQIAGLRELRFILPITHPYHRR